MRIDAETRRSIKREQKARVLQNLGKCIGIHVLYLIPGLLISLVCMLPWLQKYVEMVMRAAYGAMPQYYEITALSEQISNSFSLMTLLNVLILSALFYGLTQFYVALSREETPTLYELVHAFSSPRTWWLSVRTYICLGFRRFLWMLLPSVLFTTALVAMVAATAGDMSTENMISLATGFYGLLLVYGVVAGLVSVRVAMYSGCYYFNREDTTQGVWLTSARSAAIFRGHYGELLTFYLSFLPWYLPIVLGSVLCTIAIIMSISTIEMALAWLLLFLLAVSLYSGFLNAYIQSSFFAAFQKLIPPQIQPDMGQPSLQPDPPSSGGNDPEDPTI